MEGAPTVFDAGFQNLAEHYPKREAIRETVSLLKETKAQLSDSCFENVCGLLSPHPLDYSPDVNSLCHVKPDEQKKTHPSSFVLIASQI